MKNYIKITIFIIVASFGMNFYAAEQATETPTAQTTQLSPTDQAKIKEYRNAYELFKQAVLTSRLGAAEEYLKTLKNQFSTLSQPIRDALFATMHDDTVTHLVGEHPSEEQFFALAKKYIEDTFLTQQQKLAPRQYTEDEKKKFDADIEWYKGHGITGTLEILRIAMHSKQTPLFLYVMNRHKFTSNEIDSLWRSALLNAHIPIIECLIKEFSIKIQTIDSEAIKGGLPVVKLLVNHGANINTPNRNGLTPIIQAIFNNKPDILEFLINHGAIINTDNNPIQAVLSMQLSEENALQLLRPVLESPQADPKLKDTLVNEPTIGGLKPLCYAAKNKLNELAKLLIKHGANCADAEYKDFLVPLIKEVEAERAKTTFDVLHGATPQEQKLIEPLANIVREYIEGEQKTRAAQPATSIPSTTPATDVD